MTDLLGGVSWTPRRPPNSTTVTPTNTTTSPGQAKGDGSCPSHTQLISEAVGTSSKINTLTVVADTRRRA